MSRPTAVCDSRGWRRNAGAASVTSCCMAACYLDQVSARRDRHCTTVRTTREWQSAPAAPATSRPSPDITAPALADEQSRCGVTCKDRSLHAYGDADARVRVSRCSSVCARVCQSDAALFEHNRRFQAAVLLAMDKQMAHMEELAATKDRQLQGSEAAREDLAIGFAEMRKELMRINKNYDKTSVDSETGRSSGSSSSNSRLPHLRAVTSSLRSLTRSLPCLLADRLCSFASPAAPRSCASPLILT